MSGTVSKFAFVKQFACTWSTFSVALGTHQLLKPPQLRRGVWTRSSFSWWAQLLSRSAPECKSTCCNSHHIWNCCSLYANWQICTTTYNWLLPAGTRKHRRTRWRERPRQEVRTRQHFNFRSSSLDKAVTRSLPQEMGGGRWNELHGWNLQNVFWGTLQHLVINVRHWETKIRWHQWWLWHQKCAKANHKAVFLCDVAAQARTLECTALSLCGTMFNSHSFGQGTSTSTSRVWVQTWNREHITKNQSWNPHIVFAKTVQHQWRWIARVSFWKRKEWPYPCGTRLQDVHRWSRHTACLKQTLKMLLSSQIFWGAPSSTDIHQHGRMSRHGEHLANEMQ